MTSREYKLVLSSFTDPFIAQPIPPYDSGELIWKNELYTVTKEEFENLKSQKLFCQYEEVVWPTNLARSRFYERMGEFGRAYSNSIQYVWAGCERTVVGYSTDAGWLQIIPPFETLAKKAAEWTFTFGEVERILQFAEVATCKSEVVKVTDLYLHAAFLERVVGWTNTGVTVQITTKTCGRPTIDAVSKVLKFYEELGNE